MCARARWQLSQLLERILRNSDSFSSAAIEGGATTRSYAYTTINSGAQVPVLLFICHFVRIAWDMEYFSTRKNIVIMKGTKVQTLGARAVAGAWWLVARAIIIIMAMGAIINTHAHR